MIDARKIFEELQAQAQTIARDFNVEEKLDDAKRAASAAREKIRTDEGARNAAIGGGGLLLAALLGTQGGRRLVGGVAKTGAVAALGALAYKAWNEREATDTSAEAVTPTASSPRSADSAMLQGAGFPVSLDDADFALGVLHVMVAAAHADGVLSADERAILDTAFARTGATDDERTALLGGDDRARSFDVIAKAAKSPNHAAELYAAAMVVIGPAGDAPEVSFLTDLRDRLGLPPGHAAAIGRAAGSP